MRCFAAGRGNWPVGAAGAGSVGQSAAVGHAPELTGEQLAQPGLPAPGPRGMAQGL